MRGKPFEKGNKGKPKGTPNKLTATVKEAVQLAFNALQEDSKANLTTWGKKNPTEFYKIAAKLIPTDVKAEVQVVQEQPLFPK
jgi:hypothetical protein